MKARGPTPVAELGRRIPPPPTNGTVLAALLTKGGYLYMKPIQDPVAGMAEGEPAAALPGQPGNLELRALREKGFKAKRRRLTSRKLLLVGPDDRVEIGSKDYPWSAVGFLSVGNRGCTATLIGRRFLITAGHCVYDTGGGQAGSVSAGVARPVWAPRPTSSLPWNDLASNASAPNHTSSLHSLACTLSQHQAAAELADAGQRCTQPNLQRPNLCLCAHCLPHPPTSP
jgi:hypothetical protein